MIRWRTVAKAISWEGSGFISLGLLTWFWTGEWRHATLFSFVYTVLRVGFFYLHERLWKRTDWGKYKGDPSALRSDCNNK